MKIPRKYLLSLGAICLAFACSLLFATRVEASPAAPHELTLTQPDGSRFTARQWGDEWNNGIETLDGYSILLTPGGWWAYANLQPNGRLGFALRDDQPLLVGQHDPVGLAPHLRATVTRENPKSPASLALEIPAPDAPRAPTSSNLKTLVLLARFPDQLETYSAASFQALMFSTSSDSLRSYYRETSFNNLDIISASETCGTANDGVTEWTTLAYNHPNPGVVTDTRNQQIVKDVLAANDACINFGQFDTNGNGYIDSRELAIIVVVAGYERSYGPESPAVWAHYTGLNEITPPVLDGKVIGNALHGGYAQIGERHAGHQATIGVVAHEFGHFIDWPDLYDIDGSSYGVGRWSIMGTGGWNGPDQDGSSPAHADAFLKWYQGWISPTAVSTTQSDVSILQAEDNPVAYLLRLNPYGVDWALAEHSGRGEYFLVENRQQTLYDSGLPGCGLLFWHIDEAVTYTNEANNNESHPLVFLVQADDANDLYYHHNDGDAYDPWPGLGNHYTFHNGTHPNSKLYSGSDSYVSVHVDVVNYTPGDCGASMQADLAYTPTAPGAFVKVSPGNAAPDRPTHLILNWADASEAASYAYCYDDVVNGSCTGTWYVTGMLNQATLSGLATNTTYEWQVSASNTGGTTYANTGSPFTFTTGSTDYGNFTYLPVVGSPVAAPSAFNKSYPENGVTGLSTHPTIDWHPAAGAISYDFCYDAIVNSTCTGAWTSTGLSTQTNLSGLSFSTTYEWQVRAVNEGGTTYANAGVVWNFTTQPATAAWTVISGEDFETAIPKGNWSRYDKSVDDGGEFFIGQRNCNVNSDSYSGWLVGGGATGGTLACGNYYLPKQDSWFIYGPFNTVNATAGQLNYNYYLNSELNADWFSVLATDDYTGTWTGLGWSGDSAWQSYSFNLNQSWCGGGLYTCIGWPEVYIAFAFDSDAQNQAAYGAIIDNIVLRLCDAGSCSGGAPPLQAPGPLTDDAIMDFLEPFLQSIIRFVFRTLPE
jgi:M6 family metalloprotease-like protein